MHGLIDTSGILDGSSGSELGRGLPEALKQYGQLRSYSITQQAGIRVEERKLLHCQKRLDEETQKVRGLQNAHK